MYNSLLFSIVLAIIWNIGMYLDNRSMESTRILGLAAAGVLFGFILYGTLSWWMKT
jgi:hypothetical protein